MPKLQGLEFNEIGSLQFSNPSNLDDYNTGPCYRWDDGVWGDESYVLCTSVKQFGSFSSSKDYLRSSLERDKDKDSNFLLRRGSFVLANWIVDISPYQEALLGGEVPFILTPPKNDSPSFLIDDEGKLTGILNWDNMHTTPRFIGFANYPAWITRDWDPLLYGYGYGRPGETENTPEKLEEYRNWYDKKKMQQTMGNQGDYKFTTKSHIFENAVIAIQNFMCRTHIIEKILSVIFPEEDEECV